MKRFSSWMCALLAAFFCFTFSAFAADTTTAKIELVQMEMITAESPAGGWYAWKRQSAAYKKAHPWEGANGVWCANSTRLGIPCTEAAWKKVSVGTLFLLPAPEVRVAVPENVTPPEAIALRPTDEPRLLAPDLSGTALIAEGETTATILFLREQTAKFALAAKMHKTLNGVLLLAIAIAILFELWMTNRRERTLAALTEKERELLDLKKELKYSQYTPVLVDVEQPPPLP